MKSKIVSASVLGACIVALAAGAPARADSSTTSFNLVPGTCTAAIAVPVNNKPVFVMGSMIGTGQQGTGGGALVRANVSPALLDWAANDYYNGAELNYSTAAGQLILYLDYTGGVQLQTANSTHVQVCNVSGSAVPHAAGYLTFLY